MPDKRSHRGPHPEDVHFFASDHRSRLRQAVVDLSWLLTGGYTLKSALKLVGDRYQLFTRQRIAVMRCACSDQALVLRRKHEIAAADISGQTLKIDGYNLLTTVEAALAGGVLLLGRDGCLRDMASMHGSYRKVCETRPALINIGQRLDELQVPAATWYLDRPVSNSGRLKKIIEEIAVTHQWNWPVEIVPDPDSVLIDCETPVVSADSVILDHCRCWLNLGVCVVEAIHGTPGIIDLSGSQASS